MGWVVMSERELNRVEVLAQVDGEWLTHQNPRIVHSLDNLGPDMRQEMLDAIHWELSRE